MGDTSGGAGPTLTPLGLVSRPELPYTDSLLKKLLPLFFGFIALWLLLVAGRRAPDSRFEYEDDYLRYHCKLDGDGNATGTCVGFQTKDPSEGFINKGDCETAVSCWRPSDAESVWTCKTTTDDFGNSFFVDECVEVSRKEGGDLAFATREECEASERCGFEYPAECVEGGGCRKLDVNAYDATRSNHYETLSKCKLACTTKYACNEGTHYQCAAVISDKGVDEGFYESQKECPADCGAAAEGGYVPDAATGYCTFDPSAKNPPYDDYGRCVQDSCAALGYSATQDASSKKWLCCRDDQTPCGDTCCSAMNCQKCATGTDGKKRCVSTLPDTCSVCVNGEPVRTDYSTECSIFNNQVCGCSPLNADPATCGKTCYQRTCLNGQPYKFEGEKQVEICDSDGKCKKHKCKDVSDTRPPDCWVCEGEPMYPEGEIWRYART